MDVFDANGIQSKIIFCLMGRLGITSAIFTNDELRAHAKNAQTAEVTYSVNTALGAATVSIKTVEE